MIQEILFTQTVGEVKSTEAKITNLWDVYPCSSQPCNPVLSCCKQPSPAVPHCFLSNSQVTLQTFQRELHPQCFRNLDDPLYIFHSGTNPLLNCHTLPDKSFRNHSAQTLIEMPCLLLRSLGWNYLHWVRSAEKHPSMDLLFDYLWDSLFFFCQNFFFSFFF